MILQPQVVGLKLSLFKIEELLLGTKNGVNLVFTTPDKFVNSGGIKIGVYLNGVRLKVGVGNDFTVSESGGVGTGFDTVTLASGLAPLLGENLFADYIIDT